MTGVAGVIIGILSHAHALYIHLFPHILNNVFVINVFGIMVSIRFILVI